ncbi:MAG TPA: hypothetical protein VM778_03050 [Gemmatimonadota bacterium]|nr:hypothetical protein [Gemmatimonadota bacterium]
MHGLDRTRAPSPDIRASAIVALALLTLAGCMTWKAGEGGTEAVLAGRPDKVRVLLANGNQVELDSPVLSGDSLLGLSSGRRMAVALERVRGVEVRRFSVARTALFVGAGVTAVIIAVNVSEDDSPPQPEPHVSCPLVYSWDGEGWRLDSGTFGGAITEGLARTDVDNLEYARSSPDGVVRLKVANELAETDHLDALRLMAVDHASGTMVAPTPDGSILGIGALRRPSRARDVRGHDALERLAAVDGWSWESALSHPADRDGLELEFPRPHGAAEGRLVVDAHNTPWSAFLLTEYVRAHGDELGDWYAAMDADPERARLFFGRLARDAFLEVAIWTPDGWRPQGLAWEAGPEIVKRQVIPLDLTGVEGGTVRVRLSAPASFWLIDHVAIDFGPAPPVTVRELAARDARTRDGADVLPEIAAPDGRTWTIETGDWAEVTFAVPPVPEGSTRSYLLASTGWYRVDARRDGEPDRELLARFENEAGAIARLSRERRDRALAALAEAR